MQSQQAGGTSTERKVSQPGHILVVDDEEIIRVLLTEILTEEGYQVTCAVDGRQAVDLLKANRYDLVITDMVMPGLNGLEVLQAAFRIDPEYPVIMITGYPSVEMAVKLVNLGAADYITKPFNVDLIKVTVAKVLEMKRMRSKAGPGQAAEPAPDAGAMDQLTGTYVFKLFTQLLETEIARSQWRGHTCTLLMVGIDNFDAMVRKNGVPAGDQLLKSLVQTLQQESRPGDILGRVGQAEFVMMLPETQRNEAETLTYKVMKKVEWHFTLSAGIVSYPRDAASSAELLKKADAAMRAARSRGGNTVLLPR